MKQKWEYLTVNIRERVDLNGLEEAHQYIERGDQELNKLGDEGWELAHIYEGGVYFLFKRPKEEDQFNMPTIPDDHIHQVTQ